MDDRIFLRVHEAAVAIGVGRTTLYRAISRGDLPVRRLGQTILIPVEALQRWARTAGVVGDNSSAESPTRRNAIRRRRSGSFGTRRQHSGRATRVEVSPTIPSRF